MEHNNHPLHRFLQGRAPKGLQVELTDPQAIRLAYYFKIKFDIQNIRSLLRMAALLETNKDTFKLYDFDNSNKILLRQSLWVNSIVTYSRLFNNKNEDTASIKHIRLQKEDCYKASSSEYFKMHKKLMDARNLSISHGVKNDHDHIIPYLFLTEIHSNGEISGKFGVNSITPISYSQTDIKIFEEMVGVLLNYVEKKIEKNVELLEEKYKNVNAQTWFELALKKGKL